MGGQIRRIQTDGCGGKIAGATDYQAIVGDEQTLPYERPPLSKPDASGAVEKPITSPEILSEKAIDLTLATDRRDPLFTVIALTLDAPVADGTVALRSVPLSDRALEPASELA